MRYLHVRKLVGYGGRKIRGTFALSLMISLFLSLAYEPTDASLCILPANCKASSLPCSNKKPLYSTNHCISLRLGKHYDQWGDPLNGVSLGSACFACCGLFSCAWRRGLGSMGLVYIKFFCREEDETWPLGLSLGCLVKAIPESALLTWLWTFNHYTNDCKIEPRFAFKRSYMNSHPWSDSESKCNPQCMSALLSWLSMKQVVLYVK